MIYGAQTSREAIAREIHRRKSENPLYSMHSFAKRSGISLAYLSLIMNGKRRVSPKVADRIAAAAGLSALEREYFSLLVKRESIQDEEMRAFLDEKIQNFLRKSGTSEAEILAFDVIADWHFSALLEAIRVQGLPHNAESLGARLGLTPAVVTKSLDKLKKLKLIEKKGARYMRREDRFLRTSTEVRSLALRRFHKQALRLGIEAVERDSVEERSCTGVTMAIDPARLPEAKRRILKFQKELMEFLGGGERHEVYQLECVLFRLKNTEEPL